MTDNEDFGTHNIGRWDEYSSPGRTQWISKNSDPYSYVYYPSAGVSDAKTTARELGEDYIFELLDGSKGTLDDARNFAEYCADASEDNKKYIEFYNKHIHTPDMLRIITEHSWDFNSGEQALVCIDPACCRVTFLGERTKFLNKCRSCGSMTAIKGSDIDDVPDSSIYILSGKRETQLIMEARKNKEAMFMVSNSNGASASVINGTVSLAFGTDIPQLRVGDDHFIRARVNRESLSDIGIRIPTSGDFSIPIVDLTLTAIDLLTRLLADESVVLDMEKALDFRSDYIDSRWNKEYCSFARSISKRKIIKIDSAGLTEMLTALYNIVQNNIGAKPIIKKTGEVKFPTREVLDNISDRDIVMAFGVSEHYPFEEVNEVFYLMEDE